MTLTDRTNEKIPLSQHKPQTWEALHVRDIDIEAGSNPANLDVDADGDSSYDPDSWVNICWTDDTHDSDTITLTYEEVALLHDRLGRILGLVEGVTDAQVEAAAMVLYADYASEYECAPWGLGDQAPFLAQARTVLEAARGVRS